jgi:hypothetical protein
MGSIGRNAGNDQMDIFGVSLSAFLRSPGPLVCFQRPPYLIVAHRAKVGLGEICADIWLDTSADMDVARIDEVVRDFESPPDIVRKFYGGELLDLRIVTKSLELFGYMDIGNGARFPASASLKTFQGEAANQELMEGFFQAGHSRPEANVLFIIRASYPLSCEATMKILPDKCLFNTPLGDSEFRLTFSEGATVFTDAADPTQHYEVKRAWYQRSGITLPLLLLFIGVPVLCFVGRRYLGWK